MKQVIHQLPVQKAGLKFAGISTNHNKESMQGTVSTDVLSGNDPAAKFVNDNHKESSADVHKR